MLEATTVSKTVDPSPPRSLNATSSGTTVASAGSTRILRTGLAVASVKKVSALPSRKHLHSATSVSSVTPRIDVKSIAKDYQPRPTPPPRVSHNGTTPSFSSLASPPPNIQDGSYTSGSPATARNGRSRTQLHSASSPRLLATPATARGASRGSTGGIGGKVTNSNSNSSRSSKRGVFSGALCLPVDDDDDDEEPTTDQHYTPLPRLLPSRDGGSRTAPRAALATRGLEGGGSPPPPSSSSPFPPNGSSRPHTSCPPNPGACSPEGMSSKLLDLLGTDVGEVNDKYTQGQLSDWTECFNTDLTQALAANNVYQTLIADATPGECGRSVEERDQEERQMKASLASTASRMASQEQLECDRVSALLEEQYHRIKQLGVLQGATGSSSHSIGGTGTSGVALNGGGGTDSENTYARKGRNGAGLKRRQPHSRSPIGRSPPKFGQQQQQRSLDRERESPPSQGGGFQNPPPSGMTMLLPGKDPEKSMSLIEQAQHDAKLKFYKSLRDHGRATTGSSASSKLMQGVAGQGDVRKEVRATMERLKKKQIDEILQRGPLGVLDEPTFLSQLVGQGGGDGPVVINQRRKIKPQPTHIEYLQANNQSVVASARGSSSANFAIVRSRKMEQDEHEMHIRQIAYSRKMGLATSSGANAAYCAKTFLTWIALAQASRWFANTHARDWDPFDDSIRVGTLFHPPPTPQARRTMIKSGLLIKAALIRFYHRTKLEKKREAIGRLKGWLRMLHNDLKLKFAVHHFLARIRRIQKNWRAWTANQAVRAAVWTKQYLQAEKKLIQLLTLERELAAADEVEGNMRAGRVVKPAAKLPPPDNNTFLTDQSRSQSPDRREDSPGLVGDYNTYLSPSPGSPKLTGRARDDMIVKHLLVEHMSVSDLFPKLRSFSGTFKPTDPEHVLAEMSQTYHKMTIRRSEEYSAYLAWMTRKRAEEQERMRWEEVNKEGIARLKTGNPEVDKAYLEAAQVNVPLPPAPPRPHLPRYLRRRFLVDLFITIHADRFIPHAPGEKEVDEAAVKALSAAIRLEAEATVRNKKKGLKRGESSAVLRPRRASIRLPPVKSSGGGGGNPLDITTPPVSRRGSRRQSSIGKSGTTTRRQSSSGKGGRRQSTASGRRTQQQPASHHPSKGPATESPLPLGSLSRPPSMASRPPSMPASPSAGRPAVELGEPSDP